jgi:transposase
MLFASVYKVYVGFSSRRFTSELHDAYADGLIDSKPHFNSVSNYLSNPELTDVLKSLVTTSSLPLKAVESDFAVDSSGFSTLRFVRWYSKKHGRVTDNREWVKLHLMCGTNTKVVTGVEVSGWTAHDTNYFVPFVERTAAHFDVERVSADKAYLSHKNASAVESIGATPFVPFKSNSLPPAEDSAWSRMYHYFMFNREEFLTHYHRRSSAESVFSMVKAKFGDSIRFKSDTGQITEALCKVLCHNICCLIHATRSLGVEASFVPDNVAYLPTR